MVWIAGIDEAGRGPVLGDMVVCAYACQEESEAELRALGVKDSKMLTAQKREELYEPILALGKASLVQRTAAELNTAMTNASLNDIEAQQMAEALKNLEKKAGRKNAIERAFVDTPDPTLSTFERRLKRFYKGSTRLVLSHKADQKYAVVSAASVIAKVTRDAMIQRLKDDVGEDFGSGYSHDARTVAFLQKHWTNKAHPMHAHVRQHWTTAKNLNIRQFKLDGFL
ncbi:ribonuclease HII [Candidatus Micrarchaeota archaeon]|nr:ribonuclease HII [Candidatus Micrarchaeota archaeon]